MGKQEGVYIMRVASMITGMHPQTLRKYERAGLIEPARNKNLRMYSEEDIARLKTIKHLVDDIGLNLAGVKVALSIQETFKSVRKQLTSNELNETRKRRLVRTLDESLGILGPVLGGEGLDYAFSNGGRGRN
jgi:MerR family transcriptional regulator, heat shock protein HspR